MEIVSMGVPQQILFASEPCLAVGVVVANTGLVADENGKKILKAGTPLYGDLEARTTPFIKATTVEGSDADPGSFTDGKMTPAITPDYAGSSFTAGVQVIGGDGATVTLPTYDNEEIELPVDAVPDSSNAVGLLLHEVDVTSGNKNATMLLFGFVNIDKIEEGLIDAAVKAALAGKITFLK